MNESSKEVFRGHFDECLEHFRRAHLAKIPKGSRDASKARQPIAEFCDVGTESVYRWLHNEGPTGESHIKLMCLLDAMGYRIIELERLSKFNRGFFELIGYGLLKIDEAKTLLGYSSASTLYRVLHGNTKPMENRESIMLNVLKEKKKALEEKKTEAIARFGQDTIPAPPESMPETPPSSKRKRALSNGDAPTISTSTNTTPPPSLPGLAAPSSHLKRTVAVMHIMEGLLILLEGTNIEGLSESELREYQRSTETVLRLSSVFNILSSRLLTQQRKKGEPSG